MNILDAHWKRNEVIMHMSYLNGAVELATKPQLITFDRPALSDLSLSVVASGAILESIPATTQGCYAQKIDHLQKSWLTHPDLAETVRAYKLSLVSGAQEPSRVELFAKPAVELCA